MSLRDLTLPERTNLLFKFKQPAFRAKQLFQWIHQKGVDQPEQISNMPWGLLEDISKETDIGSLDLVDKQQSKDGTIKFLWELSDKSYIESVLLNNDGRYTACISSQVGCKMSCSFCATAKIGFIRDLTTSEIVSQIYQMENESNAKISNIVYMGMGEPLDNYDQVLRSITILNDKNGKNIGQRKITISTCGLIPEIELLANQKLQITLAVSINSADQKQRCMMMPIAERYPLPDLIAALKGYYEKTGRRVSIEYVLQSEINDSADNARELAELIRPLRPHVNLISYNESELTRQKAAAQKNIKKFKEILQRSGIEITQRYRRGSDIQAACGQLSAGYNSSISV
jgi:23S rRNA (adenine2503-C2)-methyltransferase